MAKKTKYIYQPAFLEPFTSERMKDLGNQLWDYLIYFKEARKKREQKIIECDEAYLCHRYAPDTGAIQLIEDGEFGESDVYDNMNLMSIRQALTLMPRNFPWLTPSSRESEADDVVTAIQDHQIFMHRRSRTRRNIQRHLKQKNVRGRSGIYWEWREEGVWRRITDVAENAVQVKNYLKKSGMTRKDAQKLTNGRYFHIVNNGPVIQPIDWFDLWIDPAADLPNHRRPAKIIRRYRMLEELRSEEDEVGKKKYSEDVLKELKEFTVQEIYQNRDQSGANKQASIRIHGTAPVNETYQVKYVPVYVIYVPLFVHTYNGHTDKYYDTYFEIAQGKDGRGFILFAEENPSDLGHSHILVDDCIDWFTATESGGLGLVEKQLSRYRQKNLIQLLMVTGAVHSIFPAQLVLSGAFRDDEEVSFAPGWLNMVQENPLGLDIMRPVPTPERGVQLGEQLLRFYADDMRASSGVDGLTTDNAARSLTKPKTATEINRDMSSGSLYLDNQAENDAELLTDLTQAIFEESQKRLIPDREGMLDYERYLGSKIVQGRLAYSDFMVPRSITVQGINGAENMAQRMQDLLQGLDIATRALATGQFPQAAAFAQVAFIEIWRKLNIPMPTGMDRAPNTLAGLAEQGQGLSPLPMPPQPMDPSMMQGDPNAIPAPVPPFAA